MVKKYSKYIILLFLIVAFIIGYRYFGFYLSWDALQENKEMVKQFSEQNYLMTLGIFVLIYILCTAFSIPGAIWLTIGGGFIFGAIPNLIYTYISATIGASIVFLFARYLFGEQFQQKYSDKLKKFNEEIDKNGYKYRN